MDRDDFFCDKGRTMQTLTQGIRNLLAASLAEIGVKNTITPDDAIHLEHPADPLHGDWSTNIAMILFGQKHSPEEYKNPRQFAEAIAEDLKKQKTAQSFTKIEVAGPGFINFTVAPSYFIDEVQKVVQSAKEGTP